MFSFQSPLMRIYDTMFNFQWRENTFWISPLSDPQNRKITMAQTIFSKERWNKMVWINFGKTLYLVLPPWVIPEIDPYALVPTIVQRAVWFFYFFIIFRWFRCHININRKLISHGTAGKMWNLRSTQKTEKCHFQNEEDESRKANPLYYRCYV